MESGSLRCGYDQHIGENSLTLCARTPTVKLSRFFVVQMVMQEFVWNTLSNNLCPRNMSAHIRALLKCTHHGSCVHFSALLTPCSTVSDDPRQHLWSSGRLTLQVCLASRQPTRSSRGSPSDISRTFQARSNSPCSVARVVVI